MKDTVVSLLRVEKSIRISYEKKKLAQRKNMEIIEKKIIKTRLIANVGSFVDPSLSDARTD